MSKYQLTIANALQRGLQQLRCSDSARLDCEILLLKVINDRSEKQRNKTWLLTWPELTLTSEQIQQYDHYLSLRSEGMPVAYIVGEKDFWTLTFKVTPATLIPRPETELLVECALEKIAPGEPGNILDMGTGSGAIALAMASERRHCKILATDICAEALAVAQNNAQRLNIANTRFCQSHWFDNIPKQQFDVIVSNPPYIARHDKELADDVRKYEPLSALHSGHEGLDDIEQIIRQSQGFLKPGGWLLFEHGYTQAEAIQALLNQYDFTQIATVNDLNHLPRVTQAKRHDAL